MSATANKPVCIRCDDIMLMQQGSINQLAQSDVFRLCLVQLHWLLEPRGGGVVVTLTHQHAAVSSLCVSAARRFSRGLHPRQPGAKRPGRRVRHRQPGSRTSPARTSNAAMTGGEGLRRGRLCLKSVTANSALWWPGLSATVGPSGS